MKRLIAFAVGLGIAIVTALILMRGGGGENRFDRLMTVGQGYYEKGEATNAVTAYLEAIKFAPESIDAQLNLANSYLLSGEARQAIEAADRALKLDHNSAAAYYIKGCAHLRLDQAEPAVQAFQEAQKIDPAVTALNFQLGLAHERLGQFEDAIREFETIVQFEPDHPSASYQLSRLYQRVNRATEAGEALARHQQIMAKTPNPPSGMAAYERCKFTQPRRPFVLEQPDPQGVPVKFVDATADAFGASAAAYRGPIGVIDYNHDGRNSLFVMEGGGFRLLENTNAHFSPLGPALPGTNGAAYRTCLVGDLNADRFEDVIVLGEEASHAFRFATNGQFREVTGASGLKGLKARDGVMADLDFTGRLDLLTVLPGGTGVKVFRNLGNFYYVENTATSGLPVNLPGLEQVVVEDFKNEDVPGVLLGVAGQPPQFFSKQRAGAFASTNLGMTLPSGAVIAAGDFNNDLMSDIVVANDAELQIVFAEQKESLKLPLKGMKARRVVAVDYDNDGWLDMAAWGSGIRVWRNAGKKGFEDVTAQLGLENAGPVEHLAMADFDLDGDTDFLAATPSGLRYWRNDGGNANRQLKLVLVGNRSNPSALGARVEVVAGHWRAIRTMHRLPFEMGVGKHDKIEMLKTRWFDLGTTLMDVPVDNKVLTLTEMVMPSGSCPYLYAWDGNKFRFVTDILGSAPLGLPVSETRYVEADPEEYLHLGDESVFPPRDDRYEIRITEELREVLYLDHAKLVVVDHPAGTLARTTSKMLPKKPFLPHELWTLRPRASVKSAVRSDGLDVTAALAADDRQMVSPVRLREPQLRGLAEPFSVTMEFSELPANEPLVLMLNGWLRFGGGMANIAASIDPTLPFPFPTLEAELADGSWKPVDVPVGVPCGKTKTILVDLEGKLPQGARRLRWSAAFELYLDSAMLCVKADGQANVVSNLLPERADLRWRGFSQFEPLPETQPLTPDYEKAQSQPPWRRTPFGWCTRYGPVDALVEKTDDAFALLNGGDEMALSFDARKLPPKPEGFVRDFFLYVIGWDKDADFHVGQGWRVGPLPYIGMDDQAYGASERPASPADALMAKYNTRWVGPMVLDISQNGSGRRSAAVP